MAPPAFLFLLVFYCVTFMHIKNRKPILPIERELTQSDDTDTSNDEAKQNISKYCDDMLKLRKDLFSKANKKIKDAQGRYKRDYDKKYHHVKVCNKK